MLIPALPQKDEGLVAHHRGGFSSKVYSQLRSCVENSKDGIAPGFVDDVNVAVP